jgi:hypothetical protein
MTRILCGCFNKKQITLPTNHVYRSCRQFDRAVLGDSVGDTMVVLLEFIDEGPRMIPSTRM